MADALRSIAASLLVLAGIAAAPQAAYASFSVEALLIIETVKISGRNGRTIEGLGADDFVVTEDGVPQSISICEFEKVTPLRGTTGGTTGSPSSYYVIGYYSANPNMDGAYRKIKISSKDDPAARLDYRTGYSAQPLHHVGEDPDASSGNAPGLLYKKAPDYPDEARKAKYQGTVVLHLEIGASGQLTSIKVIRAAGLGLDGKAIEAVRQWRFKPATKDGEAVASQTEVQVSFRLL